jgi:hypothetical protein
MASQILLLASFGPTDLLARPRFGARGLQTQDPEHPNWLWLWLGSGSQSISGGDQKHMEQDVSVPRSYRHLRLCYRNLSQAIRLAHHKVIADLRDLHEESRVDSLPRASKVVNTRQVLEVYGSSSASV